MVNWLGVSSRGDVRDREIEGDIFVMNKSLQTCPKAKPISYEPGHHVDEENKGRGEEHVALNLFKGCSRDLVFYFKQVLHFRVRRGSYLWAKYEAIASSRLA